MTAFIARSRVTLRALLISLPALLMSLPALLMSLPALLGSLVLLPALVLLAGCGSAQEPTALELGLDTARAAGSAGGGSLWQPPSAADGLADVAGAQPLTRQEGDCRAIDFLFVIDNSFSMEREQAILSRSFPGFMSVIADQMHALDYHVMAVDTDAMTPGEVVQAERQAPSTVDELCDGTLGAGRRMNRRASSCPLSAEGRFIDAEQPDLAGAFDCIGRVGTAGSSYEQPVGALLGATSAKLTAPGGCNGNFLRRDAVLVVTFMTDEDDDFTPGDPPAWRQALLDLKGGDESAIVMLGLVSDQNRSEPLPGGPCVDGIETGAPRLQSFVESFRFGSLGAVCASDYAPFFQRAVSVIGDACREFIPPNIR